MGLSDIGFYPTVCAAIAALILETAGKHLPVPLFFSRSRQWMNDVLHLSLLIIEDNFLKNYRESRRYLGENKQAVGLIREINLDLKLTKKKTIPRLDWDWGMRG